MKIEEFYAEIAPYLPPAFGALVGLRWAKNQTPTQKVASWATGFGLAVWFAPGVCEWFSLGPKSTVAVGILVAIVGMDIVGGFLAAGAQFREDPSGAFVRWWDAFRGKGTPREVTPQPVMPIPLEHRVPPTEEGKK